MRSSPSNASEQQIHVVLDNYALTRRTKPGWPSTPMFIFISRDIGQLLNQVEIWFGIFSRKALRGASFSGPAELRKRIEAFIASYNPGCKPFKWLSGKCRISASNNIANFNN